MGKWASRYKVSNGTDFAPSQPRKFYSFEVKSNPACGPSLHAAEAISRGAVVAIDGGQVVSDATDTPEGQNYGVLIADGLYLLPHDYDNPDDLAFINHSCEPNLCRVGGLILIAKRNIMAGEELTLDYAALMANAPEEWSLDCKCGTPSCRHRITKFDWKEPQLARKLWNEWLPEIQKLILREGILRE